MFLTVQMRPLFTHIALLIPKFFVCTYMSCFIIPFLPLVNAMCNMKI